MIELPPGRNTVRLIPWICTAAVRSVRSHADLESKWVRLDGVIIRCREVCDELVIYDRQPRGAAGVFTGTWRSNEPLRTENGLPIWLTQCSTFQEIS